jgi:hypothetical protein
VFYKWRYPATLAVTAGIAFPALAVAAGTAEQSDQANDPRHEAGATRGAPNPLERPIKRLHKTIDVQVHRIRAAQRSKLEQAFADLPGGVSQATLDAIGSCESGGDPTAVSSDGSYRGKYQFDNGTWASVGGSGDPAAAPESEQDYRAALLYTQSSSNPWPMCG